MVRKDQRSRSSDRIHTVYAYDKITNMNRRAPSGFTIVELLIVVVVIAILAAITIISYNGITQRAVISGVKSDISGVAKRFENERTVNGTSSYNPQTSTLLFTEGGHSQVRYKYGDLTSFCLEAINQKVSSIAYYIDSKDGLTTIKEGTCPASASGAEPRCVAGRVVVSVQQRNDTAETLNIVASSIYGQNSAVVNPSGTYSVATTTGVTSIPRGATKSILTGINGSTYYAERFHAYEPYSCV